MEKERGRREEGGEEKGGGRRRREEEKGEGGDGKMRSYPYNKISERKGAWHTDSSERRERKRVRLICR